jgi:hypothetical protein
MLGTGMVTRSMFPTEGPQILGVTLQNLIVLATWSIGFCTLGLLTGGWGVVELIERDLRFSWH